VVKTAEEGDTMTRKHVVRVSTFSAAALTLSITVSGCGYTAHTASESLAGGDQASTAARPASAGSGAVIDLQRAGVGASGAWCSSAGMTDFVERRLSAGSADVAAIYATDWPGEVRWQGEMAALSQGLDGIPAEYAEERVESDLERRVAEEARAAGAAVEQLADDPRGTPAVLCWLEGAFLAPEASEDPAESRTLRSVVVRVDVVTGAHELLFGAVESNGAFRLPPVPRDSSALEQRLDETLASQMD
jgi:hypothetical protein